MATTIQQNDICTKLQGPDKTKDISLWRWAWKRLTLMRLVIDKDYASQTDSILRLGERFQSNEGQVIHDQRNQLRILPMGEEQVVVKRFAIPIIINRLAYVFLRSSKAKRSYIYARLLREGGIGSPRPIAYLEERFLGISVRRSYYVSLQSRWPLTYSSMIASDLPAEEKNAYLQAVGRFTARLHMAGVYHKDYNGGNLLMGRNAQGEIQIEMIDLNRLRFRPVDAKEGSESMKHLAVDKAQMALLAESYAQERGADAEQCLSWLLEAKKAIGLA